MPSPRTKRHFLLKSHGAVISMEMHRRDSVCISDNHQLKSEHASAWHGGQGRFLSVGVSFLIRATCAPLHHSPRVLPPASQIYPQPLKTIPFAMLWHTSGGTPILTKTRRQQTLSLPAMPAPGICYQFTPCPLLLSLCLNVLLPGSAKIENLVFFRL